MHIEDGIIEVDEIKRGVGTYHPKKMTIRAYARSIKKVFKLLAEKRKPTLCDLDEASKELMNINREPMIKRDIKKKLFATVKILQSNEKFYELSKLILLRGYPAGCSCSKTTCSPAG